MRIRSDHTIKRHIHVLCAKSFLSLFYALDHAIEKLIADLRQQELEAINLPFREIRRGDISNKSQPGDCRIDGLDSCSADTRPSVQDAVNGCQTDSRGCRNVACGGAHHA